MTYFRTIGCVLLILCFGAAHAQDMTPDELTGQIFWFRPSPDLFRRLEFYRQPNLNAVTFFPSSKKSFKIADVSRGWIKLNFINSFSVGEEAFIPIGYLKRNIYTTKVYSDYAFNRASFFSEDPDDLKERAKKVIDETPAQPAGKGVASKFFRHKKKCCGLDSPNMPTDSYKKPAAAPP